MPIITPAKTPGAELNTYLKGIHMGIDSYKHLIKKTENTSLKCTLNEVLQNYKNHDTEISNRIIDLNEIPTEGVGIGGKLAETFNNIKNITVTTDSEILETAYDGCKTGVIMGQKFIEENSKILDETSLNIIKNTLHQDEQSLQKLDQFKVNI